MSKENLSIMTCKQLRDLAGERNISGRWNMTKSQLIEAILKAEEDSNPTKLVNVKSANDENKVDNLKNINTDMEDKDEKKSVSINMKQKMLYIESVEIGALVAFRLSNGKVKSAKVIRKSTKNRKLKLETNYGAEYIISYEDVIWVKTSKRWPRGVYNLLKGIIKDE